MKCPGRFVVNNHSNHLEPFLCNKKKKSQSGDKNAFGFLSNAKNLEKNPKFYRANIFQQTHCSVMQCKSDLLQLYILNNN